MFVGEPEHGRQHAQQAAVEGHSPLPDAEQHQGIAQQLGQVVEQHIAQPAAEDDPEHGKKHQIVDLLEGPAGIGPRRPSPSQPPTAEKAHQVHESIPVHPQGTEGEGDGIDLGIAQHGEYLSMLVG